MFLAVLLSVGQAYPAAVISYNCCCRRDLQLKEILLWQKYYYSANKAQGETSQLNTESRQTHGPGMFDMFIKDENYSRERCIAFMKGSYLL